MSALSYLNLADPENVGPLRVPRKQYAQLMLGFFISVGFAGLIAGVANGLIVAGLWLITLFPIVRVAVLMRRLRTRRELRLQADRDG